MKRPALGHVLGYTALTVMLTAGAAQSLSGSSTVYTDDIVDNNITAADLGTNSVSRAKIQDDAIGAPEVVNDSLTGADINESTLIPRCPSGMPVIGDICYTALRTSATQDNAMTDCMDEHLRLPTIAEAKLIQFNANGDYIWSDLVYYDGAAFRSAKVKKTDVYQGFNTGTSAYRCVTTVGARP